MDDDMDRWLFEKDQEAWEEFYGLQKSKTKMTFNDLVKKLAIKIKKQKLLKKQRQGYFKRPT